MSLKIILKITLVEYTNKDKQQKKNTKKHISQ